MGYARVRAFFSGAMGSGKARRLVQDAPTSVDELPVLTDTIAMSSKRSIEGDERNTRLACDREGGDVAHGHGPR